MKRIPIDGDYVYGAISLQAHRDGIQPWRFPHSEHALYATFGEITTKADKPSGVRIRFETNSQMVELEADFDVSEEPNSYLCLSCNNEILALQKVNSNESTWRFELPESGMCAYEIWLPVFATAKLRSLCVEEGFSLMPTEDARLKWLTYGSSITLCRSSENPCLTWPSVAARKHELNLTSMGYGGECHLDSNIGRAMRDCDADIITMKLGINVYGNSSLNSRTFCAAVIGMVQIIREKHPRTPHWAYYPYLCL